MLLRDASFLADLGALCTGLGGLLAALSLTLPASLFSTISGLVIFNIWAFGVIFQVFAWIVHRKRNARVPLEYTS